MNSLVKSALFLGLATTICSASFAGEILKGEGGNTAELSGMVPAIIGRYLNNETDVEIRVNTDQTLTRSLLKLSKDSIDLAATPVGAFHAMKNGAGPYKQMGEQASKDAENILSLFSFIGGHYHPITFESSGIEEFRDIKGRTVFLGPPAGSAARTTAQMIEAITGYQAEVDYEAVHLGWGAANQAFLDGKIDLFMRPMMIGSTAVDQLGAAKNVRILNIPEDIHETEAWRNFESVPGRLWDEIPAQTYANAIGNDKSINASAAVLMITVNESMSDEIAYTITKSFFDNLAEIHKVSVGLKLITLDTALEGLNAPLHPGAARYLAEQGVDIPDNLISIRR